MAAINICRLPLTFHLAGKRFLSFISYLAAAYSSSSTLAFPSLFLCFLPNILIMSALFSICPLSAPFVVIVKQTK